MSPQNLIRTPDNRFENLPDFPYPPRYFIDNGVRVHYIDEGSNQYQETILCLHGEPSWSYLYRKLIEPLKVEFRVLAMDFIGFGRSDKFRDQKDYSFQLHLNTLKTFIQTLQLREITLVVQDWGGLIGLALVGEKPELFARLVIMNTGLPTGDLPMPESFLRWRDFAERLSTSLPVRRVIRGGLAHPERVPPEVFDAYEAPFPDENYKAGAAVWPLLVPLQFDDPGAEELRNTRRILLKWQKPALILFSDSDPITRGGDRYFRRLIPSAKLQPEFTIKDAGHFLQEEKGAEIAEHIKSFISRTKR